MRRKHATALAGTLAVMVLIPTAAVAAAAPTTDEIRAEIATQRAVLDLAEAGADTGTRTEIVAHRAILDFAEAELDKPPAPEEPAEPPAPEEPAEPPAPEEPAEPPAPEEPPAVFHQTLEGSGQIGYTPGATEQGLTLEWSGLRPWALGGGKATLTGNEHTNSYSGYHRTFSTKPFFDATRPAIFNIQASVIDWSTVSYNNQYTGLKFGIKHPKDQSVTGYPVDDFRSVKGGSGAKNPYSWIGVVGLGPEGRFEIARYDGSSYLRFPTPKKIGYSKGAVVDVTMSYEPDVANNRVTWKIWHNATGAGEPEYQFTDTPPASFDKLKNLGFLWVRADGVDGEMYDIKIRQP